MNNWDFDVSWCKAKEGLPVERGLISQERYIWWRDRLT
jgi:hypothetical protein